MPEIVVSKRVEISTRVVLMARGVIPLSLSAFGTFSLVSAASLPRPVPKGTTTLTDSQLQGEAGGFRP